MKRPTVLFIGGLDPSAGAGILADVKTAEQCGSYGLAVTTSITFQSDLEFKGLSWIAVDDIKAQLEPLFQRFDISVVKIGFIESLEVLHELLIYLRELNSSLKVIWDPVLRTSTGYTVHTQLDTELVHQVLSKLYLLTPNLDEVTKLANEEQPQKAAQILSKFGNIYLKDGHGAGAEVVDRLFKEQECLEFARPRVEASQKHGSGCVFSAALAASLSKGLTLEESISEAQTYIAKFLTSSKDLLGFHIEGKAA